MKPVTEVLAACIAHAFVAADTAVASFMSGRQFCLIGVFSEEIGGCNEVMMTGEC